MVCVDSSAPLRMEIVCGSGFIHSSRKTLNKAASSVIVLTVLLNCWHHKVTISTGWAGLSKIGKHLCDPSASTRPIKGGVRPRKILLFPHFFQYLFELVSKSPRNFAPEMIPAKSSVMIFLFFMLWELSFNIRCASPLLLLLPVRVTYQKKLGVVFGSPERKYKMVLLVPHPSIRDRAFHPVPPAESVPILYNAVHVLLYYSADICI